MKTSKTIVHFKRALVVLLSVLSLLAACKKDKDSHAAPVTAPLSLVKAKVGDTIRIQGSDFSDDENQVKVSFNGVEGIVVSATGTEIVVVIPEGATSGSVTVTVYGNTVDAGTMTITKLTLYSLRQTQTSPTTYTNELVAIDPVTASVTPLLNLSDLPNDFTIGYLIYLPGTDEIVGLDYAGERLMKINAATKQTTALTLPLNGNQFYELLEIDKAGNLYTTGYRRNNLDVTYTLTKIDPANGNTTAVATLKKGLYGLSYVPATNMLVGMSGQSMQRYNLTTKDTSSVTIATTGTPAYENLVVDNNSNVYAFKVFNGATNYSQLVKLNTATGAETVVTTLNDEEPIFDLFYLAKTNEILSLYKNKSLYRFNLGTNSAKQTALTTDANVHYYEMTSN